MPATDDFASFNDSLISPPRNAAVVTPHDSNELSYVTRALIVGVAGNVKVTTIGGQTLVIPLPAGLTPLCVKQVHSTSTTATGIVAVW